jgi:acetoin utilization deacetylase AcuC-like enzyme
MVDWDLHHGNGTQAIFAGDRDVYCISIHSGIDLFMSKSVGLYSGTTVAAAETGHCNIPLADHDFSDELIRELNLEGDFFRKEQSLPLFNEALEKIPWQPDLILLFSGYDSHRDDCGMDITDWTEPDYRKLTRAVLNLSKRVHCPVLSVHGGGYNLPVTVASAAAHLAELALP